MGTKRETFLYSPIINTLRTLLLILLLTSAFAKAQVNLVPNPSFEDTTMCPVGMGNYTLLNWYTPSYGSPDNFNTCNNWNASIPNNYFGTQNTHTGNGYVGQGTYYYPNDTYIEYISCELIAPLIAGKTYCISLYVSLAELSAYNTTNYGIYFSENSQYYNTMYSINKSPQVIFYQTINDTINWTKLTGYYIASGGERYITMGNFYPNNFNPITINNNGYKGSYLYVDDVSIIECDVPDYEAVNPPDVFTPNNDNYNEAFEIQFLPPNSQLIIYNRWGRIVYQSNNYQNDWNGDNLSDGVYYYILTLPSGNTTKGTVTILKN